MISICFFEYCIQYSIHVSLLLGRTISQHASKMLFGISSFHPTSNTGSTCPIKGQVYHECKGCPPTCENHNKLVPCLLICEPGCACPSGQVLDEQSNTCVYPDECPGMCYSNPVMCNHTCSRPTLTHPPLFWQFYAAIKYEYDGGYVIKDFQYICNVSTKSYQ